MKNNWYTGDSEGVTSDGLSPQSGCPDVESARIGDCEGEVDLDGDGLTLMGDATTFTDLRVAISEMDVTGAKAPQQVRFKGRGAAPSTSNALFCLVQSGGGVLTIPDSTNYDWQSAFTFQFWFYFDHDTKNWQDIFRKRNELRLQHRSNGSLALDTDISYTTTADNTLVRNAWNHVLVRYTGTGGSGDDTYELIVNGSLATNQNGWGPSSANTNDLVFNRGITVCGFDNIVFHQKQFSDTEVATAYNGGDGHDYSGTDTDLKGLWKLNETSGSTASDSHASGNDGSVSGTEDTHFEWDLGLVSSTSGTIGVSVLNFDASEEHDVGFTIQMPHDWKEGSKVYAHVHFSGLDVSETAKAPMFGMEYTKAKFGDLFGDTTIIKSATLVTHTGVTKDKHQIVNIGSIDMTGDTMSTMILCRLFRDPSDDLDTYSGNVGLLEFDLHYEIDSLGSNTEWSKA